MTLLTLSETVSKAVATVASLDEGDDDDDEGDDDDDDEGDDDDDDDTDVDCSGKGGRKETRSREIEDPLL